MSRNKQIFAYPSKIHARKLNYALFFTTALSPVTKLNKIESHAVKFLCGSFITITPTKHLFLLFCKCVKMLKDIKNKNKNINQHYKNSF